ncbi:hypothetical protein M2133_002084 [Parabacteroides sp. PF5-6]|nr:hypothetical protein [Parabacteroides sp. PF5-6]
MNRYSVILFLLLLSVSLRGKTPDTYGENFMSFPYATAESRYQADSIMQYVIEHSIEYANAISRYKAGIYIKGRTEILKNNFLIQYANHLFPVERKKPDVIFEMFSESEYEAPNLYKHDFKAVNGNTIPSRSKQQELISFLNLNVYAPTIYDEAIITPVGRKAFRYYEFNLEEIIEEDDSRVFRIRFLPKQWSQKLTSGDLYIRDNEWRIEKIEMNGRNDFAEFNLVVNFGHKYGQLILPNTSDLSLRYKVLGNVVVSTYHSSFHYTELEWVKLEKLKEKKNGKREWKALDLSNYYTILSDSIPFVREDDYWENKRDIPLTDEEKGVYAINYIKPKANEKDTTDVNHMKVAEQLMSDATFDFYSTRVRYSGLLNPFQLSYSSRNGVTYKQRLRITKTFKNDRQLVIRPEVGIVFKRKELFYKLRSQWHYKPEKMGSLEFVIANDNQTYSSQMMRDINDHLKDSLFNFNDLNLNYYRHYYVDLKNTIELSNGFLFEAGVGHHKRVPVKAKPAKDPGEDVEEIINETYYDFIPRISFTYTPRQFYRMNGKRKEYVYSYYPTISLTFARGIPGVMKSTGDYGRLEMDVHQSLKIGSSLKRINYHVSGGLYTKQKSTYFAEFEYFARRNFPESWEERIGGVFHTLQREWFNASDKYVQSHIMYESPFILFNLFDKRATKHVLSERLYLGHVCTPALNNYTEVGYGFGNSIFNVAIFAGFHKHEYNRVGFRFTFEIE